ncbi:MULTISPECIES: type II secretion system F family protein [unclassified Moraxella]|uniref:type II secretion system F family protein n=1 Tax=unclassified Moraxella TaxID=2685852 RepID=UPI00359DD4A2
MTKPIKPTKYTKPTNKTYTYKGIGLRGDKLSGEIDAPTLHMARLQLHKKNIAPTSIRQKHRSLTWTKPISSTDMTLFFRQMSTMLLSGIALTKALDTAQQNSNNPTLKTAISTIKTDIESGLSLAHALKKHTAFGGLTIALVDAGERSGCLDVMLTRIAQYQERLETLKNKLKKAMYYPIFVMVVAVIVTVILLIKVVPIFAQMFGNLNQELPLPTRIIMTISDVLVAHFWSLITIICIIMLGIIWLKKTDRISWPLYRLSLQLPIIKTITIKSALARFTRTLATTCQAGIPLTNAIELSAQATHHHAFIKELKIITDQVQAGKKLADALTKSTLFLPMTVQMIQVGEEAGRLPQILDTIADYYDDQVNQHIDGLTSLVEPAVMALLGVIVGLVVMAIYLPIFQMGVNPHG